MRIRDIPMVSIALSTSAAEPKALTDRPTPIITSHKLTLEVPDPNLMEDLLRSEGVKFDEKGCVRLGKYLWVPKNNKK